MCCCLLYLARLFRRGIRSGVMAGRPCGSVRCIGDYALVRLGAVAVVMTAVGEQTVGRSRTVFCRPADLTGLPASELG